MWIDWEKRRKQVTMTVTVSVPRNMTAAQARQEVRSLVNHGAGYLTDAGECVKARAVRPVKG